MVDPGWLSEKLGMNTLSVILGEPRETGASWIVPFIFTSALDQNERGSHYRLFPATRLGNVMISSMDISLRATEKNCLG